MAVIKGTSNIPTSSGGGSSSNAKQLYHHHIVYTWSWDGGPYERIIYWDIINDSPTQFTKAMINSYLETNGYIHNTRGFFTSGVIQYELNKWGYYYSINYQYGNLFGRYIKADGTTENDYITNAGTVYDTVIAL